MTNPTLEEIQAKMMKSHPHLFISYKEENAIRMRDFAAKNVNFRISNNLRKRLNSALRRGTKSGSAVRDLGCSINELKNHLEKMFDMGMNWDNYGLDGWEIDHIKPLSWFDLTKREQLLAACHYSNLRPMWGVDNKSKGGARRNPQALLDPIDRINYS